VVDPNDALWVLDPAAPKMQDPVPGGPKLIKIDLKTNRVVQTIPFGEEIAPKKGYLNDVRIDTNTATAYITDSGKGAIVVVDLKNRQSTPIVGWTSIHASRAGLQAYGRGA
jgi:DNA-binding beta-propeller fold protein YncE